MVVPSTPVPGTPVPHTPGTHHPVPHYPCCTTWSQHGPRPPEDVHQASFGLNPLDGAGVFISRFGAPFRPVVSQRVSILTKLTKCVEITPVFQLFLAEMSVLTKSVIFHSFVIIDTRSLYRQGFRHVLSLNLVIFHCFQTLPNLIGQTHFPLNQTLFDNNDTF